MTKNQKMGAFGISEALPFQERLKRYLKSDRVHHALLLVGPKCAAKTQISLGIVKALMCKGTSSEVYCGSCNNCRRIDKQLHPDVYLFNDLEEDTIKIEIIRELVNQMNVSPIEGPNKVCLIEDAERMNAASANALLKTLEEPGTGRYFVLTTNQVGSMLPTLLSRCLEFTFRPDNVSEFLDEATLKTQSDLLSQFNKTQDLSLLVNAFEEKKNLAEFLQYLQYELRRTLLAKHTNTDGSPYFLNFSEFELTQKFEAVLQLEGRLRSNANYGLMLESLMRQHFLGAPRG